MKKWFSGKRLATFALLLMVFFLLVSTTISQMNTGKTTEKSGRLMQGTSEARLLTAKNLKYLGAFKVPKGDLGDNTTDYDRLGYGGTALAYNPIRNSLLIVGHPYGQRLVEISIPDIVNSTNLSELNTAQVIQPAVDITEGHLSNLSENGSHVDYATLGDFLVYNGTLFGAAYSWYDGGYQGYRSHFYASINWSTEGPNFHGMYMVGENPGGGPNGGFVGGYMANIPPEWRDRLGGPVITGLGGVSIISRSSFGPDAWVFNPEDLIGHDYNTSVNATMLLGYPDGHTTIGCWYTHCGSLYFDMTAGVRGVVFPYGTDTILFFGGTGLSESGQGNACCYGEGTSNHTAVAENGECWDPIYHSKGSHGYPYTYHVWAYNAYDLLKVKRGDINPETGEPYKPWDIKPYAIWDLNFPFAKEYGKLPGVAYDPSTQRLFVSEYGGERFGLEPYPLIHVYKIENITQPWTVSSPNHKKIRINNNTELAAMASSENWPGDGSVANPYIIENLVIDAHGDGPAIYLGNTTMHAIFRECYLYNASWSGNYYYDGTGVLLYNVTNVIIERNNITGGNDYGILLYSSRNNVIKNNNITYNYYGIYLGNYSDNNTITGNKIKNSGYDGVFLYGSSNNTISYNTILASSWDGISLFSAYNMSIKKDSNDNKIYSNNISWNGRYGIYIIYFSSRNLIYGNVFFRNHYTYGRYHEGYIQAHDDGLNNSWNTSTGGNYWYDWANNNDTNDQNGDGIVDWPYAIDGSAGSADMQPLKSIPSGVPEMQGVWPVIILVVVLIVLIVSIWKK